MIDAARAGKHIFCEKPMAPTPRSRPPLEAGAIGKPMHTHDFDLARWLMNDEVDYVSVEEGRLVFHHVDIPDFTDNTVINLRFCGGTIGNVDGSYNAWYGYDVRTEVLGESGAVFVGELRHHPVTLATRDGGVAQVSTFKTDNVPHFMHRFNEAYTTELSQFVRRALTGRSRPPTKSTGTRRYWWQRRPGRPGGPEPG